MSLFFLRLQKIVINFPKFNKDKSIYYYLALNCYYQLNAIKY